MGTFDGYPTGGAIRIRRHLQSCIPIPAVQFHHDVHRHPNLYSLPSSLRRIHFPGLSNARQYPAFQIQMGSFIAYRFRLRIAPRI